MSKKKRQLLIILAVVVVLGALVAVLPGAAVEDGDVVRGNFFVQIGAFSKKDNAQGLIERLTRSGQKGRMIFGSNNLWNVQVGPWEDSRKADEMMRVLRALYPHAFVVGDGGAS